MNITTVIDYLNSVHAADPAAVHSLLCNYVPTTLAMEEHPHAVIITLGATGTRAIGMLGVLNGLLTSLELPRVAAKWEVASAPDKPHRFVGFCVAAAECQSFLFTVPVPTTEPKE